MKRPKPLIALFFLVVALFYPRWTAKLETSHQAIQFHVQDFSSFRPQTCFELFNEDSSGPSMTMARRRELGRPNQYILKKRYEERVSPVVNGQAQVLYKWVFPMHFGNDSQVATITSIRTKRMPGVVHLTAPPPSETQWRTASRAMDFVIETYRERRPHWTPEFLEKLKRTALEYLPESTYITVEDGLGVRERPIRGTLRLIKEKNGFLPMEKYLGIEIDAGSSLKVEPGNFAIDKSLSAEAWPEIMMQLWSQVARDLEPGRTNHYYTYADKYSLKLYAQLGFKPIARSKMKVKSGMTIENGKILVNDVWWTPMEASQADLDQLLGIHVDRLQRRRHDPDEVDTLLSRREELSATRETVERNLRGRGFIEERPVTGQFGIQSDRASIKLTLKLDGDAPGVSPLLVFLDPTSLPLKEGALQRSWVRPDLEISYHHGRLRFESQNSAREVVEIETSPDLSVVTRVRKWSEVSGNREDVLEIEF